MSDLVDRYLACWNETDPQVRTELLDNIFATDVTYVDPMADVRGVPALDATIVAVQAQFDGWVFAPIGTADAHHNATRFSWGLGPSGAEPVVVGFDVAVTDDDGRITSVVGFLDRVPG